MLPYFNSLILILPFSTYYGGAPYGGALVLFFVLFVFVCPLPPFSVVGVC